MELEATIYLAPLSCLPGQRPMVKLSWPNKRPILAETRNDVVRGSQDDAPIGVLDSWARAFEALHLHRACLGMAGRG